MAKGNYYLVLSKKEIAQYENFNSQEDAVNYAKEKLESDNNSEPVAILKITDSYMVEKPPVVKMKIEDLFNRKVSIIERKSTFSSE